MISLSGVQKETAQGLQLDIPSLQVEAGEMAVLVGAAGNGQEILLELLLGHVRPSMGLLRIANINPFTDKAEFSRQAGVLFAENGLYKNLSVMENLLFACRLYGLPKSRAEDLLVQVGLVDHSKRRPESISLGMQRRLAFARAIIHSPQDLILVEPFQNCDDASIEILRALISHYLKNNLAILAIALDSHRLDDLATKVYNLNQGRIMPVENPAEGEAVGKTFRIPVKLEGRVALINPGDILYAAAEGDTAVIQTLAERLPTQYTLSQLEERLGRHGFFRAHRAYLVNLQHVTEVIPFTRNSFSLRLDDKSGTLIPLSKSSAAVLRDLFDF